MATEELDWETFGPPETDTPDRDIDALHILPLAMVPVQSEALRELKLIKNYRLESVVEVHRMRGKGSLQVEVAGLPAVFGWSTDEEHPDLTLLRRVSELPSFDIYSLRHLLRELGHPVNDDPNLQLSEEMTSELSGYMTVFTRPLISRLYAGEEVKITKPGDLAALFNDPDRTKVLQRLQILATELGIGIEAVPRFLEDYGDVLLSLSFYKRCLDQVTPIITEFLGTMDTVRGNEMLGKDEELMEICANVEAEVNELTSTVAQRFQELDHVARDIWKDPDAQGFRGLKEKISEHHTGISGVLCGLTVKMGIWEKMFPDQETASPAQLAEFIKYHMKQGLETMRKVQVATVAWDLDGKRAAARQTAAADARPAAPQPAAPQPVAGSSSSPRAAE